MTEETNLHAYLKDSIKRTIQSWPESTRKEIYVISLFVHDAGDDSRRPTVTLGYNTISQFKSSISEASDEMEAKWNYAFWLQNTEAEIGNDSDRVGRGLIEKWVQASGLNYTEEEWDLDIDRCSDLGARITAKFLDLLIRLTQELYSEKIMAGFIEGTPVLIHEYEYYDKISEQNLKANPRENVAEFVSWINSM